MYQHVFWFYSHPAVYIMMLPGFGIISEVIAVNARKPIFGYRMMAFSLVAIVVLGLHGVGPPHVRVGHAAVDPRADDGHHGAHRGARPASRSSRGWRRCGEACCTSTRRCSSRLGFLTMFTLRRDLRRHAGDDPADHPRQRHLLHRRPHPLRALRRVAVHDLRRRLLLVPEDDRPDVRRAPGQAALLADLHLLQPDLRPDAPRRHRGHAAARGDYADQFADWNLFISISSFLLGPELAVFAYNMVASWRGGPQAVANPWRALTLEWQVSSPPPIFNFDAIPTVVGGPYEYGVPGAVHGVFKEEVPAPAGTRATPRRSRRRRVDEDRPRGGQRDPRRRRLLAADQGEGGRGGRHPRRRLRARAPARATATSSTTRPSSTPPRSASTSRARSCARRASRPSARSAIPTPTRR